MQYRIVSSGSASDLEGAVNTLISLGWKPLGGISGSEKGFYQAMTKG